MNRNYLETCTKSSGLTTISDCPNINLFDEVYNFFIQNIDNEINLDDYKQNILNLQEQIKQGFATRDGTVARNTIAFVQHVTIKLEYVYYIRKYGFPEDGFFEPSKLIEFMP